GAPPAGGPLLAPRPPHLPASPRGGDTRAAPPPFDDLPAPPDGAGPHLMGRVGAGLAADPVAVVEDLAGLDALLPVPLHPLPVLRVHRVQPAAAQVLIQALAGDPAPLRGILRDLARRGGHPDDLRTRLDQRPVALLAPADRLLGVAPLGDVDGDHGA